MLQRLGLFIQLAWVAIKYLPGLFRAINKARQSKGEVAAKPSTPPSPSTPPPATPKTSTPPKSEKSSWPSWADKTFDKD